MDSDLENRLIELETRIAYQDDSILKLQALVEAHQKQLYHLDVRFENLLQRYRSLHDSREGEPISNERPPHY